MHNILTLVVNLEGSTQRLDAVAGDLDRAGIKWQRLDAVDFRGRDPSKIANYDSRACHIRHDGDLTGGEMGCVLSHHKSLQLFLVGSADFCLILEDDAEISQDAAVVLRDVIDGLNAFGNSDWDVIFLALKSRGFDRFALAVGECDVMRTSYTPCGTAVVLWTRAGAQSYLGSRFGKTIRGPIDREFRSHFARRGRSYKMTPAPFSRRTFKSDIDPDETRFAQGTRRHRSSVRCRVQRHFPDYFHAWLNTWMWRLGLR